MNAPAAHDLPAPTPTEAIVSVTNRCDARCTMCNIWRMDRQEWLGAEDYRRALPPTLRNVNITGGEALLRPDIEDIVRAIHENGRPRIIIATNGFRTERTVETISHLRRSIPDIGVAVSLDGDEAAHDRMRGVPRAFRRAIETLRALRAAGIRDLRIGFTATRDNIGHLLRVYDLSVELGVEFTATVAQNSDVYYGTRENLAVDARQVTAAFGALADRRLASASPKNWLRAYFDEGVIHFATTGERLSACDAASGFFYLAPTGDVFPCLTLNRPLGNLRTQSFDEIWHGALARSVRSEVRSCRQCWMMCTARTELQRQPVAVGLWLARAQWRRLTQGNRRAAVGTAAR